MNYNPYAAPQAPPPPPPGATAAGAAQPWDAGEVLGQAWEIFKQHWGPLLGAMVVAWLLSVIPSAIIGGIGGLVMGLNSGSAGSSDPSGAAAAGAMLIQSTGSLVSVVIQTFLQVGLMRMILAAARGQAPQFGDLFGGAAVFVPLLLTNLLFGLVVATATMCLIVPGVIAYCGLWMAPYYVVDANIRPVEALKTSWEAMKGQKGKFFVFLLLAGLIGIAGVLACGVGLFVAMPLVAIAMGVVFLRISGRGVPALSPAMAAPPGGYGGPPPGYGPPQGGGYGGPPPGGGYGPPGGGGYGGPQGGGGYGPQGGGGYGGPQGGGYGPGGGYGGPQGGGGGYGGPPPGGGGFPQR